MRRADLNVLHAKLVSQASNDGVHPELQELVSHVYEIRVPQGSSADLLVARCFAQILRLLPALPLLSPEDALLAIDVVLRAATRVSEELGDTSNDSQSFGWLKELLDQLCLPQSADLLQNLSDQNTIHDEIARLMSQLYKAYNHIPSRWQEFEHCVWNLSVGKGALGDVLTAHALDALVSGQGQAAVTNAIEKLSEHKELIEHHFHGLVSNGEFRLATYRALALLAVTPSLMSDSIPLFGQLSDSEQSEIRIVSTQVVGEYLRTDSPPLSTPLLRQIKLKWTGMSQDRHVSVRAEWALVADFDDPEVWPIYKQVCADSDCRVRVAAMTGLEAKKDYSQLEPVLRLRLHDSAKVVVRCTLRCCGLLCSRLWDDGLEADAAWITQATLRLADSGDSLVDDEVWKVLVTHILCTYNDLQGLTDSAITARLLHIASLPRGGLRHFSKVIAKQQQLRACVRKFLSHRGASNSDELIGSVIKILPHAQLRRQLRQASDEDLINLEASLNMSLEPSVLSKHISRIQASEIKQLALRSANLIVTGKHVKLLIDMISSQTPAISEKPQKILQSIAHTAPEMLRTYIPCLISLINRGSVAAIATVAIISKTCLPVEITTLDWQLLEQLTKTSKSPAALRLIAVGAPERLPALIDDSISVVLCSSRATSEQLLRALRSLHDSYILQPALVEENGCAGLLYRELADIIQNSTSSLQRQWGVRILTQRLLALSSTSPVTIYLAGPVIRLFRAIISRVLTPSQELFEETIRAWLTLACKSFFIKLELPSDITTLVQHTTSEDLYRLKPFLEKPELPERYQVLIYITKDSLPGKKATQR